jgi:hypothetical protein
MIEKFTSAMFAEQLKTKFRLTVEPSQIVELELFDVLDASTPRQERYSILFRGPHAPFLQQRIYQFEHDQMGTFDLFIVPIGVDEDGYTYEAVFNRIIKKTSA